jgi:hypothetical protein
MVVLDRRGGMCQMAFLTLPMAVTSATQKDDDSVCGPDVGARKEVSMEFTFALGYLGAAVLVVGSIAIGVLYYLIGSPGFGYEWVATAIGAFVGALVVSEFIIGLESFEPVYDGLALIPALAGGLIVGGVVAAVTRFLTRDTLAASAH